MMRKWLLIIIVSCFGNLLQAQEASDTLSMTELTTTDFMQIRGGGRMNWGATTAQRICFWHCKSVAENNPCCFGIGFGWVSEVLDFIGGLFSGGDPTLLTNNNNDGSSGGGGGTGMGPGPGGPPSGGPHLGIGGGGSGSTGGSSVGIATPPPKNPAVENEKDTTKPVIKDCAGVRNGKAYRDSCGYCVGGTTNKQPCVCPTDSNFTVTKEMLLLINPLNSMKASDTAAAKQNMDSVMKYINLYKNDQDFQINTKKRLAHLLAQLSVETDGFTSFVERHNYSKKTLLKKPKLFDSTNVDKYVNCVCVFDKMYCCKYGNGDTASKDGSKYRGQGAIHLTWKENYEKFNTFYQSKFNDYSVNFKDHPELLQTNMKYATIAALWYVGKFKKLNDEADSDDVLAYSRGVNIGNPKSSDQPNSLPARESKLKIAKNTLCL